MPISVCFASYNDASMSPLPAMENFAFSDTAFTIFMSPLPWTEQLRLPALTSERSTSPLPEMLTIMSGTTITSLHSNSELPLT